MDLKEIKVEVNKLPQINKELNNFRNNWIKPIRANTNQHLPFINRLSDKDKEELNHKLMQLQETIGGIQSSQIINEKLQQYSRQLIELKLTTFNQDTSKSKLITNQLLNDDFMNMKQTIVEIKSFSNHVDKLYGHYEEINELLHKKLSLEEALFFMELPHQKYLYSLIQTAEKHKSIIRDIGRHFVNISKEAKKMNPR